MRVMINEQSMDVVKDLRLSEDLTHDLTYTQEEKKKKAKLRQGSVVNKKNAVLPRLSMAALNQQTVVKPIHVKAPEIILSSVFNRRGNSLEDSEMNDDISRNGGRSCFPRRAGGIFLTNNDGKEGSEAEKRKKFMARLLRKRMEKRVPKEGAAEVEFKYQKVLDRHNTHIQKRGNIFENIQKTCDILHQKDMERAEQIQHLLNTEVESYAASPRLGDSKGRKQDWTMHLLGLRHAKLWQDESRSVLAVPKRTKPRYVDAVKDNSNGEVVS